jgi:Lon protease-like protein
MWPFAKGGSARELRTLPLFPLSTVLFPGGVLPLRIFEQRYIEMAKRSLQSGTPFGVCLITHGEEVARSGTEPPTFAMIGTLARIVDFDPSPTGILEVVTRGDARFRVASHRLEPSGLVVGETAPMAAEPRRTLTEAQRPLANFLELVAARLPPRNFPEERDYDDASWVGYRLAEVLPLPLPIKQSMLEISDADVRLTVLQKFLSQQGLL